MQIYGVGNSRSFRCVWAAEEAGVDYQYIPVVFGSQDENGSVNADYRAKNPQGKVPTLVDGDLTLCESGAIVNYLGLKAVTPGLVPADTDYRSRVLYDQVAFYVLSDLEQPLWTCGKHKFAIPKEYRVAEVIPTTVWEFEKSQKALLKLLNGMQHGDGGLSEFVLGENFSMVDVLLAHTLSWAESFKYELLPEFKAYKDRMYGREACQRAQAKISE